MAAHKHIARDIALRLLLAVIVLVALVAIPAWAGNGNGSGEGIKPLSDEEIVYLNFTREEEKLARDVYLLMFDTYGAQIFSWISESEQQHMDTMLKMLDKYGLPDPASSVIGEFNDEEILALYQYLVDLGLSSYLGALQAGVWIEVTDIADINEAIDSTVHVDLQISYGHLVDGSYSHLAAFCKVLEQQGETEFCASQDIDQEVLNSIMEIY